MASLTTGCQCVDEQTCALCEGINEAASPKQLTPSELRLLRGRIKHWLRETVILMVDNGAAVKIHEGSTREDGTQFKIECSSADIGKLIGKQGRNARSLRIILLTISKANGHNFTLDVLDGREDARAQRLQSNIVAFATN